MATLPLLPLVLALYPIAVWKDWVASVLARPPMAMSSKPLAAFASVLLLMAIDLGPTSEPPPAV